MQCFEYKVVPAPRKGEKAKGAKTTPDRFALTLTLMMNDLGREGWEYVRADALPCDERVGFTGSKTTFQNVLVFRRVLSEAVMATQTQVASAAPRLTAVPEGPLPAAPAVLWPVANASAPTLGPANSGVAAE